MIEVIYDVENGFGGKELIDFRLDGINGIFRVINTGKGVNLDHTICQIEKNKEFFRHLVEHGVRKVFEELDTRPNWGGGSEWQETTHFKLAEGFRLNKSVTWFTCPGEGVKSMRALHPNIQSDGIKLLYSYNPNRSPVKICYFFPLKGVALSAV